MYDELSVDVEPPREEPRYDLLNDDGEVSLDGESRNEVDRVGLNDSAGKRSGVLLEDGEKVSGRGVWKKVNGIVICDRGHIAGSPWGYL